ncbi:hypothetical protein [Halopseudomonas sp.]|uniref:hypothetical protein n=1 Tax=Halopseudomonas sp. TaxID=2901191 RepID=UPI003001AA32
MSETRRYLQHIELEEITKPSTEWLSIPSQLHDLTAKAFETLYTCYGENTNQNPADKQITERLIDDALSPIAKRIYEGKQTPEGQRAYSRGRLFSTSLSSLDTEMRGVIQEQASMAALMIYQIDRLIDLQKAGSIESILDVFADLSNLHGELTRSEEYECVMADAEWEVVNQASKRAKLRHKETNQNKIKALAEWEKTGHNYSSMAAFATQRRKAYDVKERTLYDWIRGHCRQKL